jgi:chromosome segregation ATPase
MKPAPHLARFAFLALVPAALASGCAPQNCDPSRDKSIFQVAGCVTSGSYQQRVDRLSLQADQAETDRAAAEADRRSAESRRDSAATRAATLRGELASQQTRSIALERDIQSARQRTRVDQQRLSQLEQDLAGLRAEQDRLRSAPPSPQQQSQLQDLRRRQESLESQWDRLRASAPRD